MNSDALCVIHVWFNFLCVCVLGGVCCTFSYFAYVFTRGMWWEK